MVSKKINLKIWICEDKKCEWKGEEFNTTPANKFLGIEQENCEEEYIETCPKCGKLAILSTIPILMFC